jgi:hypothetical protein
MEAPFLFPSSLSLLSIKMQCPRCDESVLPLHVYSRHRNPRILRIMLR